MTSFESGEMYVDLNCTGWQRHTTTVGILFVYYYYTIIIILFAFLL